MSSASSSIETPAFRRRTFDWLSTSLLKGMSREALRVIFGTAFAMLVVLRDGRPKDSLSTSNPSQNLAQPSHSPSLPDAPSQARTLIATRDPPELRLQ